MKKQTTSGRTNGKTTAAKTNTPSIVDRIPADALAEATRDRIRGAESLHDQTRNLNWVRGLSNNRGAIGVVAMPNEEGSERLYEVVINVGKPMEKEEVTPQRAAEIMRGHLAAELELSELGGLDIESSDHGMSVFLEMVQYLK